jgi:hypothetical protein
MQKSFLSAERGQVLVLIALAAIGLFGIVGLAIDGGAKFSDRRHAQNAADTAVLSAALVKVNGLTLGQIDSVCSTISGWTNSSFCLDIINAAWDRADENGYDGLIPDSVDVYSPPISGPYTGNSSYIQVIITSYVNTYFARVVGINQTRNTVEAVAFVRKAGVLGDGAMLISYDPDPNCSTGGTGGYSVQVNGSSTVNLTGGGIFLNSDEVCGFQIPNCADLNISSGAGISSVGANNINQDGCTKQAPEFPNQDPIDIPDEVYWPDVPPECSMSGYPTPKYLGSVMAGSPPKLTEEWLIYPGYYTTFPQATLVAKKSHIYMASGVYCIDPGGPSSGADLSWSSVDSARLNGSTDPSTNKYQSENPDGVTLYIKSGGGFVLNSNNPTFLDGSTTGDYQGYLIILEGTHTSIENCSISGGADLDINGLIFAPYCDITVNGGSSSTAMINAQLLAWDIKINGGAGINFNYNPNNAVHIKRRIGLMR